MLLGMEGVCELQLTKFAGVKYDLRKNKCQSRCLLSLLILKQHCAIADEDCYNVVALKDTCLPLIEDKLNPHILHKAAVFINGRQTSMKAMPYSTNGSP